MLSSMILENMRYLKSAHYTDQNVDKELIHLASLCTDSSEKFSFSLEAACQTEGFVSEMKTFLEINPRVKIIDVVSYFNYLLAVRFASGFSASCEAINHPYADTKECIPEGMNILEQEWLSLALSLDFIGRDNLIRSLKTSTPIQLAIEEVEQPLFISKTSSNPYKNNSIDIGFKYEDDIQYSDFNYHELIFMSAFQGQSAPIGVRLYEKRQRLHKMRIYKSHGEVLDLSKAHLNDRGYQVCLYLSHAYDAVQELFEETAYGSLDCISFDLIKSIATDQRRHKQSELLDYLVQAIDAACVIKVEPVFQLALNFVVDLGSDDEWKYEAAIVCSLVGRYFFVDVTKTEKGIDADHCFEGKIPTFLYPNGWILEGIREALYDLGYMPIALKDLYLRARFDGKVVEPTLFSCLFTGLMPPVGWR